MSEGRPEIAAGKTSNHLYCERLVEVAFPSKVWIGSASYREEELRAALPTDWRLRSRTARKYGYDPTEATVDQLVEAAFPSAIEIDGANYDQRTLHEELLSSSELQRHLAEKLHYASNELYLDRLAEVAFQSPQGQKQDDIRVGSKKFRNQVELLYVLRQGDRHFQEQVGKLCNFPRSKWLSELYCKRLMEVAFPARVEIEGRHFNENALRENLKRDHQFRCRVAGRFHGSPELPGLEELVAKVFPSRIGIGDRHYSKDELLKGLPSSPKLQQQLAARTYFSPSKWLVEQEMQARGVWNGDPKSGDIYKIVAEKRSLGVCFSGGGIRSATFNLGVLQGLAQLGLVPCIDYLSSVSGGGYIHEFLAGWILRNGKQSTVIQELIPQAEPGCLPRAPEPIQWLKQYSSYLTPSRGILSTDTWTAVAIWLRNTILNQVPILMAFAAGFFLLHLLIPQPIKDWHPGLKEDVVFGIQGWWISGSLLSLYAIGSVYKLSRNLYMQEQRAAKGEERAEGLLTNGAVVRWVILPWLGCSIWLSYWVQMPLAHESIPFLWPIALFAILILAIAEAVIFLGGACRARSSLYPDAGPWGRVGAWVGFAAGGVVSTLVALALAWAMMRATELGSMELSGWAHAKLAERSGADTLAINAWRIRLAILPGLLLGVPYVAIELTVGLLGRSYWSMRREWLARLRAWSLLYALLWAGIVSLVLLGPYVGYYIHFKGPTWVWSTLMAFFVSHGATVFAGWSAKSDGKPTDSGLFNLKAMDLLAFIAAPIAIISLLLMLSFAASVSVDGIARVIQQVESCPATLVSSTPCSVDRSATDIPTPKEFLIADGLCLFSVLTVAWVLGWRADINQFSMHDFYKNRLSRCYLGATVPGRRRADPFTGFDDRSQVSGADGRKRDYPPRVRDLLPVGYRKASGEKGTYEGPFPIFCATLNLTTGADLATQERKGTSFAFTPLHSGYSVSWTDGKVGSDVSFNGFVPTDDFAYRNGGILLDSAVAISGAALNPNQGYNSNPALAFLMTFFNVRLGWWISNTRKMDAWPAACRSTPRFPLLHLFKELFGMVGDGAKYMNLSDGGHFENMGLYELVRRRCTYIIVCDAEVDPEMKFEGMGAAITKCRADFGAEIDLDLRPLRKQPDTEYSKTHCVVGTIRYPPPRGAEDTPQVATACRCLGDTEEDDYRGVIVYMKTSLVGDEPADLLTHQLKCAAFPQDSTSNQWFTETLFEAYRRLGHHIAMSTIRPAISPLETRVHGTADIPLLFEHMHSIWYPRTPEMEKHLADNLKQYEGLLKEMRERRELFGLEERLYDPRMTSELPLRTKPGGAVGADSIRSVIWTAPLDPPSSDLYASQFSVSIVNFMFTVYTNLQLGFPDNRVSPHAEWWICLFRRWCRVSLVQDVWIAHDLVHSEEFRLFAIRELGLP